MSRARPWRPPPAGCSRSQQQARRRPIGFANPELYARYRTGQFHDVTDRPLGNRKLAEATGQVHGPRVIYTATTLGTDGDLHAAAGYDDATGLGSPTAAYLASFEALF